MAKPCRCAVCARIHSEFIGRFGKWPTKTHAESLAIEERRERNAASWPSS